jgi:hypothetical protein
VGRPRLDLCVTGAEVLTFEGEARFPPQAPDDLDRLAQGADFLAWAAFSQAESRELTVVTAGSEAEDQAAAGKPVEGLGHLRGYRRGPVRKAEHVGHHAYAFGHRGYPGKRGPRLRRRARAMQMIGDAEEVEAQRLGVPRLGDQAIGVEALETVDSPETDTLARDRAHPCSIQIFLAMMIVALVNCWC